MARDRKRTRTKIITPFTKGTARTKDDVAKVVVDEALDHERKRREAEISKHEEKHKNFLAELRSQRPKTLITGADQDLTVVINPSFVPRLVFYTGLERAQGEIYPLNEGLLRLEIALREKRYQVVYINNPNNIKKECYHENSLALFAELLPANPLPALNSLDSLNSDFLIYLHAENYTNLMRYQKEIITLSDRRKEYTTRLSPSCDLLEDQVIRKIIAEKPPAEWYKD